MARSPLNWPPSPAARCLLPSPLPSCSPGFTHCLLIVSLVTFFFNFCFLLLYISLLYSSFASPPAENMMNNTVQFSSVAQLCPILCDPMNRSTPGLPVHHQLPEFTQTHIHRVSDAIQPSHPLNLTLVLWTDKASCLIQNSQGQR